MGWYEDACAAQDEFTPGPCDLMEEHHIRNEEEHDCVNHRPEYDLPGDYEDGTTWYHSQWEAMHPLVTEEDRMRSFR